MSEKPDNATEQAAGSPENEAETGRQSTKCGNACQNTPQSDSGPENGSGAMEGKHTPGPWEWYTCIVTKSCYLATPDRGRLFVMGFERWGMHGAKPLFRDLNRCIMLPFDRVHSEPDHNGDCTMTHPDAILIAASPDLLAACKQMAEGCPFCLDGIVDYGDCRKPCEYCGPSRSAIAKAEGGDNQPGVGIDSLRPEDI